LSGSLKLVCNRWKILKYTAAATTQRLSHAPKVDTSAEHPLTEDVEATAGSEVAIPFGIRAILSGIEIEGVWISRSNSPTGCRSRVSSVPFLLSQIPRIAPVVSEPSLLHSYRVRRSMRDSSTSSFATTVTTFERAVEAEKMTSGPSPIWEAVLFEARVDGGTVSLASAHRQSLCRDSWLLDALSGSSGVSAPNVLDTGL